MLPATTGEASESPYPSIKGTPNFFLNLLYISTGRPEPLHKCILTGYINLIKSLGIFALTSAEYTEGTAVITVGLLNINISLNFLVFKSITDSKIIIDAPK